MTKCLIDDILPTNRVHLLGGASDAGKTRFVIPMAMEWEQGRPVLGRASHPAPWAYVVGDRLLQEAYDTMSDMGYNPHSIRMIPAFGQHNKNWLKVLMCAAALQPKPELLIVEGFGDFCPGTGQRSEVREFLSECAAYCEPNPDFPAGLTILGIMESPKMKPNEKYENPRQRISGVSAWQYHSSTVMLIEHTNKKASGPDRNVWICMKNALRRGPLMASFDAQNRLIVP